MRQFLDLINEAMMDNMVFHSTDMGVEILESGVIQANSTIDLTGRSTKATDTRFDTDHHATKGVCVTRSFYFARQFSDAIFGIDLSALRHNFKLVPRTEAGAYDLANDFGDYRLEAEEFVICPGIDVARYVRAIWVSQEKHDDPDYQKLIGDPRFNGFFRQP